MRKKSVYLGENVADFFERNNPKQVASVLKHRREICDFINKKFTGYYKDPKIREKIASRKEELRRNLNFMNDPLPQTSPFNGVDFVVNRMRLTLPREVYQL